MARYIRAHIQTQPPSGQGLTLTLKSLCFATVIATPQAGYAVSTSVCEFYEPKCMFACINTMHGVHSGKQPQHTDVTVTLVCVYV